MKTVIIYKTKTGFTKRYAEWIKTALNAELVAFNKRKKVNLGSYDTVIFGSGMHMGMISGVKWFKKQLPRLDRKKLIVFVTGAAPAESDDLQKSLLQNFTSEEYSRIKTFFMQSGLAYEKMGALDKILMSGFCSMLKKTEGEDSIAYKTVSKSFDVCSKDFIRPLVEYAKS